MSRNTDRPVRSVTPSVLDSLDESLPPPGDIAELIGLVKTAIGDAAGAERVATLVAEHLTEIKRMLEAHVQAVEKTPQAGARDILMSPWLLVPAGVSAGVTAGAFAAFKLFALVA